MNLKNYYAKVRELEASLADGDVLVVSEVTPDGGKAGVKTLVERRVAAQLVVEARARLASDEERAEWEFEEAERREDARRDELAQRIQVQVITDTEPRKKPHQG
jgi:hypothetical protein